MARLPTLLLPLTLLPCAASISSSFVQRSGTQFTLDGAPFSFSGTNCYYLSYSGPDMLHDVLSRASRSNFTVLRTWAWIDVGYVNGSDSIDGAKNGLWFQGFDPVSGQVVINSTNLNALDAVVAAAAQYGVKLILTLTNNWRDFGGADQYLAWAQMADASYVNPNHDDFYVTDFARATYKAWATAIVTRVNSVTGVKYSEDPSIMAWELMNEPRCQGSGVYPSTNNCTLHYAVYNVTPIAWKIPAWVDEMSTFIKTLDGNHLVAVGDEGFLCQEYQACPDTTCDCYYGTDFVNMTALPNIDFGSMHLYPGAWGKDDAWGAAWILNHTQLAHGGAGKPVVLGEFGVTGGGQSGTYAAWGQSILSSGMNGDMFWMMCGLQPSGGDNGWYPSYDGLCVYCVENATDPTPPSGDPQSCAVLSQLATQMQQRG